MDEQTLRQNIDRVLERIAAAESHARRSGQVALIAVSKTQPAETVAAAARLGLARFGENRVEEAGPKAEALAALALEGRMPLEWHMVGHLQSRKAEDVFPWASLVHSVDSIKLAGRLSRATRAGVTLPILLQVNVSGETSKEGFAPEEVPEAVRIIAALPGLRIDGLMTMAPIAADPEDVRPVFRALRGLRDDLARQYPLLSWRHLSMGMTDDFEIAIEEGATLVRIGRAIFGER
jgi:pyridoxal phosphate enzyme (YggS family)